MFGRRTSPAKKKFITPATKRKPRRVLDPRTKLLIKQGLIGLGLFLFVLAVGTALWYFTRIPSLTITNVTAEGGETIDSDLVTEAVHEALKGEYIGLIPKQFSWWYPETAVYEAVLRVPRLKNPVITKVDGSTLSITYDEYIPYALWCEEREAGKCLFLDESGFAFIEAPELDGGALPRFVTIGTKPTIGMTVLPLSDMRAIEILREEISRELHLPIAYVETDIARDVFMGVAGGGEIKASLRLTPQETFDNLRAILSSDEFSDLTVGNFKYIDLRFGNKVFVNENIGPATMSSTTEMATTSATSSS